MVEDGSSQIVCPFHALPFDAQGCTVLPGSKQKTLPQLQPLELVIQGDFIWSYGGYEPEVPIPTRLKEIADTYDFISHTADTSVATDLLTLLLNMHDYNHQNGTHRHLFQITEVQFHHLPPWIVLKWVHVRQSYGEFFALVSSGLLATATSEQALRYHLMDSMGEYFGIQRWGIYLLVESDRSIARFWLA